MVNNSLLLRRPAAALSPLRPCGHTAAATANAALTLTIYRSNIGHTGVSSEKLTAPLSRALASYDRLCQEQSRPRLSIPAASSIFLPAERSTRSMPLMGRRRWQYPSDGKAQSYFATTPALAGGFLYVTDDNGQAYKLDAATGKEIWTAKLDGTIRSAPVISGGAVYFGSGNSHCYALSTTQVRFSGMWPRTALMTTSPTITGGLVIFASSDNNVYSLNAHTGKKAWSVAFDADPSIVPLCLRWRVTLCDGG